MGDDIPFDVVIGDLLFKALVQNTGAAQVLINAGGSHFGLVDGVDDVLGATVGIAAYEDTGHRGGLGVAVCHHTVPIELDSALDELGVRRLGDGGNDDVKLLHIGLTAGHGLAPAGAVELAQLLLHDADAVELAANAHKVGGVDQGADLDAFFQSVLDLHLVGGHIFLGPAVKHDHFLGAQTDCGTGRVDGGVAAADDGHLLAGEVQVLLQDHPFQEVQAVVNPFQVFPRDPQVERLLGTDGDKDGVVVLLQGAEGHVHTDLGVENDVDPSPLNVADLPLDDIARQTIVGNAIAHDAAGTVLRLVNIDMVAQPGQVVGTGQTGGASADDGDLLIHLCNGLEVLVRGEALGIGPVGSETLQFADVHGLVHGTAAAAALTGMGTDTAADAGEGIVAEHHPGGAHVIASGDEAHVAGDVDASGAGVLAGAGNQLAANTSGTSLLHDVLLILRAEVLDGRQNRVGCRLSQAAHGGILDDGAQVL